jgi:hypothetical protein
MASPHFSCSSFSFLAVYSMSSWSCANNTWSSEKLSDYTYVFWIGISIGWHFLFQFLNTHSRYVLNRVGDKLQPCFTPFGTLKPFVIRFPIFIFELDPFYNDFIASINLVLRVDLSRVSHNLFNGTLSYAFVKPINNSCNSLLVTFFFFYHLCYAENVIYARTSSSKTWLFFHLHILIFWFYQFC